MSKQYGDYVILSVMPGDPKDKKIDAIKIAVSALLENVKEWPVDPDLQTIQLIVREGWQMGDESDAVYAMTVGIKCECADVKTIEDCGERRDESCPDHQSN